MKWVLIVLGALAALAVVVYIVGSRQPKDHEATLTVILPHSDSAAWATISDIGKVPEWFSEVKSNQRIADVDGQPAWRENYGGFEVVNVTREAIDRRKLVREILPTGAFSGTWTIELVPEGASTRITITERGHIENAFIRAMMIFNDNEKTMRAYAAALEARLKS